MKAEEQVLCFERRLLDKLGSFQGLSLDVGKYMTVVASPSNLFYRPRSEAEQDMRYKQLIPYVIIVHDNRVLRYRRGRGGGEGRLHGLYSIGVGGHISNEDVGLFSDDALGYYDGMRREVEEEVAIEAPLKETAVAVINDDCTEVGSVHFAVVHIMRIANESVAGRRKGILAPEFIDISSASKDLASYETWSRLCLENISSLLSKAESTDGTLHQILR